MNKSEEQIIAHAVKGVKRHLDLNDIESAKGVLDSMINELKFVKSIKGRFGIWFNKHVRGIKYTIEFCFIIFFLTGCAHGDLNRSVEFSANGKGIKTPYGVIDDGSIYFKKVTKYDADNTRP